MVLWRVTTDNKLFDDQSNQNFVIPTGAVASQREATAEWRGLLELANSATSSCFWAAQRFNAAVNP